MYKLFSIHKSFYFGTILEEFPAIYARVRAKKKGEKGRNCGVSKVLGPAKKPIHRKVGFRVLLSLGILKLCPKIGILLPTPLRRFLRRLSVNEDRCSVKKARLASKITLVFQGFRLSDSTSFPFSPMLSRP
jgi:hypothetical protein